MTISTKPSSLDEPGTRPDAPVLVATGVAKAYRRGPWPLPRRTAVRSDAAVEL